MKINIQDASNYFKGLLLLIRKDRKVTDSEVAHMKNIGKVLGFEKEFCDTAIRDILENKYIEETPPQFSSKEVAKKFIKDGLILARSDNELHPHEEQWLKHIAEKNKLDLQWFDEEKNLIENSDNSSNHFEANDLSVDY